MLGSIVKRTLTMRFLLIPESNSNAIFAKMGASGSTGHLDFSGLDLGLVSWLFELCSISLGDIPLGVPSASKSNPAE